MNRPERIDLPLQKEFDGEIIKMPIECEGYMRGYNIAMDDWESYLPTEQDLFLIIIACKKMAEELKRKNELHYAEYEVMIAKAIHERISK